VRRWRWWLHLVIIGSYPLIVGLVAMGRPADRGSALTGDARGLLMVCLLELLVFGTFLGLGLLASRASREDLLLRWRGWLTVPLGLGYSFLIRLVAAIGFAIVLAIAGGLMLATGLATPQAIEEYVAQNKPNVESVINVAALRDDPAYYWLSLTLVSFVVAGLREELWRSASLAGLRKLWPQSFGTRRGEILGVMLTAVIFGLGHVSQGLLGVALTGMIGACLGGVMIYHRSIWPAVIAHGFFDATSMALLPLVLKHT
jgi:membrane protease YdiL (CAAX protease family)